MAPAGAGGPEKAGKFPSVQRRGDGGRRGWEGVGPHPQGHEAALMLRVQAARAFTFSRMPPGHAKCDDCSGAAGSGDRRCVSPK